MPVNIQEAQSSQSRAKGLRSRKCSDQRPVEKSWEGPRRGRVPGTQILGWDSRVKPLSLKKELEKRSKTVALKTKIFQGIVELENQEQNGRNTLFYIIRSPIQPGTHPRLFNEF